MAAREGTSQASGWVAGAVAGKAVTIIAVAAGFGPVGILILAAGAAIIIGGLVATAAEDKVDEVYEKGSYTPRPVKDGNWAGLNMEDHRRVNNEIPIG